MEMKMKSNQKNVLRNQCVVEMWRQNSTSGEIADYLGMTRSAVMGVIGRNGEQRNPKKKVVVLPLPETKAVEEVVVIKPIKIKLTKPEKCIRLSEPFSDLTHVETQGKKIMDLGPFDCRWIFDDNSYCAQPKTYQSYCIEHAKIVYVAPSKREVPRHGRRWKGL